VADEPDHSLLRVLDLIRARPGMYLGAESTDHGALLDRLEAFISGYEMALHQRGLQADLASYGYFARYVAERLPSSQREGPIRTVRRKTSSDAKAWETLWRLLSEFGASRDPRKA
jgi:hypothetical protein